MIARLRQAWARFQLERIIAHTIIEEQIAAKASEKAAIKRTRRILHRDD